MPNESQLLTAVCNYLDAKGWFFHRINTTGIYDAKIGGYRKLPKYVLRGAPDIILIDHTKGGQYVGLEIKLPKKGIQSPEQKMFESWTIEAKARYHIIRSIDDLELLGF